MNETTTVQWEGRLGLRESDGSARRLDEALASGGAVTLDTRRVEVIDISHLQILIAAHRFATAAMRGLEIIAPSGGAVREALERSGIAAAKGHHLVWRGDAWIGIAPESDREAA